MTSSTVVYRSLGHVWQVLGAHGELPEVRNLLALCVNHKLLDKNVAHNMMQFNNLRPNYLEKPRDSSTNPFIVIEGLDGTGKTTLTKHISALLNMKLISTPPKVPAILEARAFFDNQPESFRRAFYSLGNYLAAQEVVDAKQPVVMDRFWHSTAAYAMAHQIKSQQQGERPKDEDFVWPSDLLKPDLVIFLQVSEQERLRRHGNRSDFTNTAEEKTLAENESFRQSLLELYRRISGPQMIELNVDGEQTDVEAKIVKTVTAYFPSLSKSIKKQQQQN